MTDIEKIILDKLDKMDTTQGEIFGLLRTIDKTMGEDRVALTVINGKVKVLDNEVNGIKQREGNRNKAVMVVVLTFIGAMVAVFFDVIRGK